MKKKGLFLLLPLLFLMVGCGEKNGKTEKENTTAITTSKKTESSDEIVSYIYDGGSYYWNQVDDVCFDLPLYYDLNLKKVVTKTTGRKVDTTVYYYLGQWVDYERIVKEYDEYGNQTLIEIYYYSEDAEKWVGLKKEVDYYDDEGDVIKTVEYDWSRSTDSWVKNSAAKLAQNIYDASKNILLEASAGGSSSLIGTNSSRYVIDEGNNTYSVTIEALIYLGEIEGNFDYSGTFRIYLNNYNTFSVELYNFRIEGQQVFWDSTTNRFYQ